MGGLIAGVGVDRGHDAALDADALMQRLGQRREAVGGARPVRDHLLARLQHRIIDAEDHGAIHVLGGGRDQHLTRAAIQMRAGFGAVVELAGAFEHHIDAFPVQFVELVGGHDLDRPAPQIERVARHRDRVAKAAMHAVVAHQVRGGLDRAGGIDLDDLDIVAQALGDMGERAATDAAETVDADGDGHGATPVRMVTRGIDGARAFGKPQSSGF